MLKSPCLRVWKVQLLRLCMSMPSPCDVSFWTHHQRQRCPFHSVSAFQFGVPSGLPWESARCDCKYPESNLWTVSLSKLAPRDQDQRTPSNWTNSWGFLLHSRAHQTMDWTVTQLYSALQNEIRSENRACWCNVHLQAPLERNTFAASRLTATDTQNSVETCMAALLLLERPMRHRETAYPVFNCLLSLHRHRHWLALITLRM